jgi:hypothetical protein
MVASIGYCANDAAAAEPQATLPQLSLAAFAVLLLSGRYWVRSGHGADIANRLLMTHDVTSWSLSAAVRKVRSPLTFF